MFMEMDLDGLRSKQIPISSPALKSQRYGFGEFFTGIHFLNLGFEDVTRRYYYSKSGYGPYEKAIEILGVMAAKYICRNFPQPPDLLVFDKKGQFFLAEAKLPTDRLNENQRRFFRNIELYLNKNVPQIKRASHLPPGHWIELVRLKPILEA